MKVYRYLTGKDDAAFCHRVTEALNWRLVALRPADPDIRRRSAVR